MQKNDKLQASNFYIYNQILDCNLFIYADTIQVVSAILGSTFCSGLYSFVVCQS